MIRATYYIGGVAVFSSDYPGNTVSNVTDIVLADLRTYEWIALGGASAHVLNTRLVERVHVHEVDEV